MKVLFVSVILMALIGCVTPYKPALPEGYQGEIARIGDTFQRQNISKANFFVVESLNNETIFNALDATADVTTGVGSQLNARGALRDVPVQELNITLVGQSLGVGFGSFGKEIIVRGEVTFLPQADQDYLVKGQLSDEYSTVWIEDLHGNVVSQIIEKSGEQESALKRNDVIAAERSRFKEEHFLNLSGGESIEVVTKKLGEPDNISKYKGNFFIQKAPSVTYEYTGMGKVIFSAGNDLAPLFVDQVIPTHVAVADLDSIKRQLESGGLMLRTIAQEYYEFDNLDQDALDLLALKIWQERNSDDAYMLDAVAWLCKVLGKNNNSRYKEFLIQVVNTTDSKKLQKYAEVAWESIAEGDSQQFSPE